MNTGSVSLASFATDNPLTSPRPRPFSICLSVRGRNKAIGIGSPRASLESNFFLRTLVGPEHFYAGVSEDQFKLISTMIEILRAGPAHSLAARN